MHQRSSQTAYAIRQKGSCLMKNDMREAILCIFCLFRRIRTQDTSVRGKVKTIYKTQRHQKENLQKRFSWIMEEKSEKQILQKRWLADVIHETNTQNSNECTLPSTFGLVAQA